MISRSSLIGVILSLCVALACTAASAAVSFTFSFNETGTGTLSDGSGNTSTVTGALLPGSPNWDGTTFNNVDVPLAYDLSKGTAGTALTEFLATGGFDQTGGWVQVNDSNGLSDWIKFAGTSLVEVFSGTWTPTSSTTGTGSEGGGTWGGVPSVATVDGAGQPVQTSDVPVLENSSGVASYTPNSTGYTYIQSNVSHTPTTHTDEQGYLGGTGNTITYVLTSFDAPGAAAPEAASIVVWSLLGSVGLAYGYRRSRRIG